MIYYFCDEDGVVSFQDSPEHPGSRWFPTREEAIDMAIREHISYRNACEEDLRDAEQQIKDFLRRTT